MSTLVSQVGPALLAMIFGWVLLWQARCRVGAAAYHLWAMPTGALVYVVAGCIAGLTHRPLDAVSIVGGLLVMWVAIRTLGRLILDEDAGPDARTVGWGGFVLAAGALIITGAAFAVMKWTIVSNDALVQYWPMSIGLIRGEGFTIPLMSDRGMLIPAVGAAHILFGAGWSYVMYPLLAANTGALVGWVVWDGLAVVRRRWVRVVATVGLTLLLMTESSFVFHAVFVHSHMYSALYMMMSLVALWRARKARASGGSGHQWLVLAGLAAAGLALARPDGMAYALVSVAAAVAVLTDHGYSAKATAAFFVPLLAGVYAVYGSAFVVLGIWSSEQKLTGTVALGMLCVVTATVFLPRLVELVAQRLKWRIRGDGFLVFSVGVLVVVLIALAVIIPERVSGSLANATVNLFWGGGAYGALWYFLAGIGVLSVLSGDALKAGSVTKFLFLSITVFFLIGETVHAVTHVGRIGDLDSFTRIVFQALPLAVWYVGAVLARIVGEGD